MSKNIYSAPFCHSPLLRIDSSLLEIVTPGIQEGVGCTRSVHL